MIYYIFPYTYIYTHTHTHTYIYIYIHIYGFPDGSVCKKPACFVGDTGDTGLIHGSGRSPGEGNGNLLQYSRLGNHMDRGAW